MGTKQTVGKEMTLPLSFKKGQLIIRSKPIIYSLSADFVGTYCSACFFPRYGISSLPFAKPDLKKCSTCGFFEYCSDECAQSDWNAFHQYECEVYSEHGHEETFRKDLVRGSLRCLILMQHRPEQLEAVQRIPTIGKTSFMDCSKHEEKIKLLFCNYIAPFDEVISFFTKIGLEFDTEKLRDVLLKYTAKQVDICDFITLKQIGNGLYLGPSLFKHSCLPNANLIFDGTNMQVRALRDINKKESITISHCSIIQTKLIRHFELGKKFLTACSCVRCTKNPELDDELCKQLFPLYRAFREKIALADRGLFCVERALNIFGDLIKLNKRIIGQSHSILTFNKFFYFYYKVTRRKTHQASSKSLIAELKVTHGPKHTLTQFMKQMAKNPELRFKRENREVINMLLECGINPNNTVLVDN